MKTLTRRSDTLRAPREGELGMVLRMIRFLYVAVAEFTLFVSVTFAQGGPPFRSDDPDTPGNRQWEINLGLVGERNPVAGSYEVPNIDINYGLGHRIQLKYELPLNIQEVRGGAGGVAAGLGNFLLGVKYRFYAHHPRAQPRDEVGERESTFGLSVYPQLMLNNPTRSVAREIAVPGPQFLFPLEASAKAGPIRISGEVGYWFTPAEVPRSWIRGAIFGHEFRKDTELYFEIYDQQDVTGVDGRPKARESTLGIGGRLPIVRSGSLRLIGMFGRSLIAASPTNGQPSWIAYLGIQFLSARRRRHSSDYMEATSAFWTPVIQRGAPYRADSGVRATSEAEAAPAVATATPGL